MKLLMTTALGMSLIAASALARKPKAVAPCQVSFSVVMKDNLGNLTQGLPRKGVNWYQKKVEKKYPDVCYTAPAPDVRLVFFIAVTPAVYHGTRVVTTEDESNTHTTGDISGTVTGDVDANLSGDIDLDSRTTTTHSAAVPYSVDYGVYTLTVETSDSPGKWQARRRFQQRGLYRTLYGIPLGGKGHHPAKAVIEEAAKWIHEGGLTGLLEGSVPVNVGDGTLTRGRGAGFNATGWFAPATVRGGSGLARLSVSSSARAINSELSALGH